MSPDMTPAPPEASPLRATGRRQRLADPAFRWLVTGCGAAVLVILAAMIGRTTAIAWPVYVSEGLGIITGDVWDPGQSRSEVTGTYGGFPFIYGTLVVSGIALAIALPLAVGVALYITELAPPRLRKPLAATVDLLAAVPSIVYALVGLFFLNPVFLYPLARWVSETFGGVAPFLAPPVMIWNYFLAANVLALMILPIISAISREVFAKVPESERHAAYAMGATRAEVIAHVVLPRSVPGVTGATMLGLGRALGETIAVAFLIGASQQWAPKLFFGGDAITSVIVNTFQDARPEAIWALMALGVVLFVLTMVINVLARVLVWRVGRVTGDAAV